MKKWDGGKLAVLSQADARHVSQQLGCIAAMRAIVFARHVRDCRAGSDLRIIDLDDDSGRRDLQNDIYGCLAACGNGNIVNDDDLKSAGNGGDVVEAHGKTIKSEAPLAFGDE